MPPPSTATQPGTRCFITCTGAARPACGKGGGMGGATPSPAQQETEATWRTLVTTRLVLVLDLQMYGFLEMTYTLPQSPTRSPSPTHLL